MRITIGLILCFFLNNIYSNNDSLVIVPWSQMSSLADSNNYNLFFCGPSSVYKSILFESDKLSILSDHPFYSIEQIDIPNLNLPVPIVDVYYLLGAQQEQNLAIYHSQPISKRSNYSIAYLNRSHNGYYKNQSTNSNYFQAHYFLNSKNNRYKIHAGIKNHRIYIKQNGGISNDSNFTNASNLFSSRLLMDVNMDHSYSNDKLLNTFINQSLKLSSSLDTSHTLSSCSNFINFSMGYLNKFRNYYDSLSSNHFLFNYYDSIFSNDTLNKNIWYTNLNFKRSFTRDSINKHFSVGLYSEIINHYNQSLDSLLNNHNIESNFTLDNKASNFSISAKYFLEGYKKNNFELNFNFSKKLTQKILFSSDFSINDFRPAFELQNFVSNHQIWYNSFNNMTLFYGMGALQAGRFSCKLNYSEINNPIYFNEISMPNQFDGSSQVIQTSLNYKLNRNKIGLLTEIIHQYQGGGDIFQLPELIAQLKFNYSVTHKKTNLNLFLGVNARYYSSFDLMNYSPTINQFTISKEKSQNQYFIADFIVKTRIKRVTLYLMISHLNSGLMGYNYFTALNYPSPDRYVKFGINWLFLN
tara:strand:- start:14907 stop:16652 length:1746 start_codon:yes stop_codon:yes gene_type:complete